MKTMKFLCTALCVLFMSSCTNEAPTEDLSATEYKSRWDKQKEDDDQEKEKPQHFYELDIRQNYILGQLTILEEKDKKLKDEIEEGNSGLIPLFESNLKWLDIFKISFDEVMAERCHILGLKADLLAFKASQGDEEAERELEAMDEALRFCGIYVSYIPVNKSLYGKISIGRIGTVGGCSMPTPDSYGSCQIIFDFGRNEMVLGEDVSLLVLDKNGKPFSKPRLVRNHEIDGLGVFGFDLPQDDYTIKVTTDTMEYTLSGGEGSIGLN